MANVSDEVVVVIKAQHDELQKGLDEAGSKLEGFANEVEGIAGGVEEVFAGLSVALTAALDAFVAAAYEIGKEFEAAYNKIRARTGETGTPFEGLQESLKNVMEQSAASSDDLSNTLTRLHSRLGLTGEALENLTVAESRLASATNSDLNSIVDSSARAFNAWGISVDEQVPKLDEFMRAYQQTGTSVDTLTGGLQRFAPTLQELGFSFDQSVAMIASFDQAGINVTRVMMGMQTGIKEFAANGESSSAAFARMVKGIKDGTVSLEEANKVFGSRAGLQLFKAIQAGRFDVDALYKSIALGGDSLQKVAADTITLDKSIGKLVNRAKVALEPFAIGLINLIEGTMIPVINKIGTVIMQLGDMFNALPQGMKDTIVQVTTLIATLATGAAAFTILQKAVMPIISTLGLSGLFEGIAAAVSAALGPIAVVVAALAALGYVLYDLWTTNAEFRNEILAAWYEIQAAMAEIMAGIQVLFDQMKQLWLRYGDDIMGIIQPMWENLKNVVGNAVLGVLDIVNAILDVLSGDWEGAWFHLSDAVDHVMNIIIGLLVTTIDVVKGLVVLLFKVFYDWGVSLYNWGNETGTAMYTAMWEWMKKAAAAFVEWNKAMYNMVVNWLKSIATAVYNHFADQYNKIKTAHDKMHSLIAMVWEKIKLVTLEKVIALAKSVPAKFNEMKDLAVAKVTELLEKVRYVLTHLPEIFAAAMADAKKALDGGFDALIADAWEGASNIANAISSALSGVGDAVEDRVDEAQSLGKTNAMEGLYSGLQAQLQTQIDNYEKASKDAQERVEAAKDSIGDWSSGSSGSSSGTDELLEQYNKFGDAVASALKEHIEKTAELEQKALDDEIEAVRKATDEKIEQYNREYDEKCALIDQETERFTGSLTEELRALEEAQEEADRKATAAANKSKLDNLRLEVQIARAENDYEALAKAEANLAAEETRQAMEAKKAEMEKQKQEIRDQIDAIKAQADAMKEAAKKELDKKTTTASDNATNRINILEQQKEEATAFWESMSKEENVQAETYKLAVGKHQDEVIALLATYNPKWQDAGRSYGDMFLNGLQSSNIEAAVASMLSGLPGANMADVASTVPGLDALVANQKATAPGGSAGYGFNPADLAAAFSQALAPLVSTGKEITINLDGTMLGRLMLPKLITEAERSGLALV